MMRLKIFYAILLFIWMSLIHSFCQQIKWNDRPQYAMVFSITSNEAKELIIKHKDDKNGEYYKKLLYNLIDTFNLKNGWLREPDKGHFIIAQVVGNKLFCRYKIVTPFQVFLINEYDALALQIIDNNGKNY